MKSKVISRLYPIIMLIAFVLSLSSLPAHAQGEGPVRFENLTREDGVTGSEIRNVIQDEQGRIWFGTRYNGVNVYDGYAIKVYAHDPDDPHSLGGDPAFSVYKDSKGTIWVAILGAGLSKFDPETESFTTYRHDPDDPTSIWHDSVQFVFEDREGNFWVAAANGLDKMDREAGTFTHFSFDPNEPVAPSNQNIKVFYQDREGGLWLGLRRGGLRRIDPDTGQVTHAYVHDPDDPNSISDDNVFAVLEDHTGTFWVGSWQGLNILDRETGEFTHIQAEPDNPRGLSDRRIFAMLEDSQNNLWVGTGVGLNKHDRETGEFTRYYHDPNDPNSLVHNEVLHLYEDTSGILWISTLAGLSKLDLMPPKFTSFQATSAVGSLNSNDVEAILEDTHGTLWFAAEETLNQWNQQTRTFSQYQQDAGAPEPLGYIDDIFEDSEGMFWLGTQNGLFEFDPETGTFGRYNENPAYPLGEEIRQIAQDQAGYVWLNVQGAGLKRVDPETGVVVSHYYHDPNDPHSISDDYINHFFLTPEGVLWIGSEGGLDRLDIHTEALTRFSFHPEGKQGRDPSNDIQHIYPSPTGTIWVSTIAGLNALDPDTGDFTTYTTEDGLPSNLVVWTTEDGQGNLWVGTNNGLAKFNPQANVFRNYDVTDGLVGIELSNDMLKSSWGEVLFVSVNRGVNAFHPDRIQDNPYVPPVILTDFQLFNHSIRDYGPDSVLPKPVNQLETLTLSHDQSVFTLEFAALNYRNPEENLYQYRLEGFDKEWSPIGTKRSATYTNLDPGEYVFRVRGSNNDGVWNETGKSLRIVITPPWWETWWFRGVVLVVLLGLIIGGYRWRISAIERRNLELEAQIAERTRELVVAKDAAEEARQLAEAANRAKSVFLANMSHELRTPLNAILGYSQLMARDAHVTSTQREHLETIARSGEHLLGLINNVLTMSKIEAGRATLQENGFDLHWQLQGLQEMFQVRARDKGLTLLLEIAPDVPRYVYADEGKLREVLMNLLSNAIKFTEKGGVALRIASRDARREAGGRGKDDTLLPTSDSLLLLFEVEDTGVGIASQEMDALFEPFVQTSSGQQSQEGTGLGLPISRQFVNLMGGELGVRSIEGQGATFRVQIPVALASADAVEALDLRPQRRVTGIEPGQTAPDGGPFRLLVVEDNVANRELLIKLLEPLGFDVRSAVNGAEGVEMWEAWQPHLVWMDMRMPVMDGYEATRQIKARAAATGHPAIVVALTASVFEEDRETILATGCDEFVRKPFREGKIFDVLHRYLGVRFVYETVAPAQEVATRVSMEDLQATVGTLPATWVEDLHQAVLALNYDQMLALIEAVRSQAPHLVDTLAQWVRDFEYEKLLSLVASEAQR